MQPYALPADLYAAGLVFMRVGAIAMLIPGLGEVFVPPRIRLGFALLLALCLMPVARPVLPAIPATLGEMGGQVLKELLIGLMLGALLRFMLAAFPAVLFVKRPQMPLRWLLAYGATISLGQFAFLFTAMYVGMPAGLASVVLQAQVNYTARTSMEVGCRVETEDMRTGIRRYVTKAYLTFVAVDDHGRPRAIDPLRLATDEDVRRHAEAERRRAERLKAAGRHA